MTNLAPLTWQDCVQPDWQVSPRVRALITTRDGGVSEGPYGRWQDGSVLPGGMNLGLHTGDDPAHVAGNRARLLALAGQSSAAWLEQVHGAQIVRADAVIAAADEMPVQADASVTDRAGAVCVVMVADCLPVLLCDAQGR
ncbi:polyphenol oxidase family protein, partial [Burkholderia stabilis]